VSDIPRGHVTVAFVVFLSSLPDEPAEMELSHYTYESITDI